MPVPLLDLTRQYEALREEIRQAIDRVCDSQRFILGAEVEDFEREAGAALESLHAVGVTSGTDALLISLMAADIGPGDAVLTTPYTFFATAGSIARTGARPVFSDIDPDTYNLSSEGFRKLVFLAGYAEPFLESYRTALVYFAKNRRNHHHKAKMLKKMLAIGNRMHRQGEIRLKESISKANYANAIAFFGKNKVRGSEDEESIRQWNDNLVGYQHLISR